jgi:hypothetical protein
LATAIFEDESNHWYDAKFLWHRPEHPRHRKTPPHPNRAVARPAGAGICENGEMGSFFVPRNSTER